MLELPDELSRCVGVVASEKMSVGCADEIVWVCRYCLDCARHC